MTTRATCLAKKPRHHRLPNLLQIHFSKGCFLFQGAAFFVESRSGILPLFQHHEQAAGSHIYFTFPTNRALREALSTRAKSWSI